MTDTVCLFRGINVGGAHIVPMKELRALLEELGCEEVRTYIQSGNAVFRHRSGPKPLAKKIRAAVARAFGFEPGVLVLSAAELARVAEENPFPEAAAEPKSLHLSFLTERPKEPDLKLLEELRADDEAYHLSDSVFYLHAPSGIARSKLAGRVERALGVSATSRNWRTVTKLLELVEG